MAGIEVSKAQFLVQAARRRQTGILIIVSLLVCSLVIVTGGGQSAKQTTSAVQPTGDSIIIGSSKVGKTVQEWFYCAAQSTCTDLGPLQKSAGNQIDALHASIPTVASARENFPKKLQPLVDFFALQVSYLWVFWHGLPKAPTQADQIGTMGVISIVSEELISFAATFSSLRQSKPVPLEIWKKGPLNAVSIMDNYGRVITANPNSASDARTMDSYISFAARILLGITNGPSAKLNTLIHLYALNQIEVSDLLGNYLRGKAPAPQESWLTNKNKQMVILDSQIRAMESSWFSQG